MLNFSKKYINPKNYQHIIYDFGIVTASTISVTSVLNHLLNTAISDGTFSFDDFKHINKMILKPLISAQGTAAINNGLTAYSANFDINYGEELEEILVAYDLPNSQNVNMKNLFNPASNDLSGAVNFEKSLIWKTVANCLLGMNGAAAVSGTESMTYSVTGYTARLVVEIFTDQEAF